MLHKSFLEMYTPPCASTLSSCQLLHSNTYSQMRPCANQERNEGAVLQPDTLIEILDAAHMTHCVASPFKQRGGIILAAPPGQMKSSMIAAALQPYGDALLMSDINVKTLMELRTKIVGKKVNTLAFVALEKLYARNFYTAANVEASLMAMIEEGFTKASFESQDGPPMRPARALVVGGTFSNHIEQHWNRWKASGFVRRFVWVHYSLDNPEEIIKAIHYWEPLKIGKLLRATPIGDVIPYDLTEMESSFVLDIMKDQNEATPIVLMKKIFCVLKWKYSDAEKAKDILDDFAPALSKDGGLIELPRAARAAHACNTVTPN